MVKRVIIHWSAGRYYPTAFEKRYYHYLIDFDGKTVKGNYSPEDNDNCKDKHYAAHTGGGNTGSVGICICAMAGFVSNSTCGDYPITRKQFEACMKLTAEICQKYNIPITEDTVMTHYEFGKKNPKTTSKGKIDIIYLPPFPWLGKNDIGQFIRTKVRWYSEKLKGV